MIIVGENINATSKAVKDAIVKRNKEYIRSLAKRQVECGADYLDVNVGTGRGKKADEIADMEWLVEAVQEVIDKPLMVDSSDPDVIAAGLKKHKNERPIINSVNAEKERLEAVLPIAKEFDVPFVALAMGGQNGEQGIPPDAAGRVKTCNEIVKMVDKYGISLEKIYFDPIVLPISTNSKEAIITLETLKDIKKHYPESKTIMGLSNVSFGLPQRSLINQSLLIIAMYEGLDSVIIDPFDQKIISMILAANTVLGKDSYCKNYLKAYRKGALGKK